MFQRVLQCLVVGSGLLSPSLLLADNHCEPAIPDPVDSTVISMKKLTIEEAIYLTMKYNQTLQSANLGQESNFWNLKNAYFNYQPQLSVTGSASYTNGIGPSYALTPTANWQSLIGTSAQFTYTPSFVNVGQGNSAAGFGVLSVTQPLLRGFGVAFNSITLKQAIYSYQQTNLNYKNTVINAIVTVINNFRAVTQAARSLEEAKVQVVQSKQLVHATWLKIKNNDPNTSPGDLVQLQQQLATNELAYVQQRSAAETQYQSLLASIGLPVNTKLVLDDSIHIAKSMIPNMQMAVDVALKNNISYLQQEIAVNTAKLTVIQARNAAKWQLDLTGSADLIAPKGINPITGTGYTTTTTAGANLSIPVFNVTNSANIVNAEVALAQAEINLANTRRQLITQVQNAVIQAQYLYDQVVVGQQQVALERDSLRAQIIRQAYGQSDAFAVSTIQNNLLTYELSLISTQISFENSITTLDQLLGRTLEVYKIKLKY